MQVDVSFALLLTTLAGLSTGIGSTIAYFIRKPKYSYLSVMLGFSAGVMVYISFAELLKTAIEEVGFGIANLGFFVGIIFIAIVDMLVPHSYEEEQVENTHPSIIRQNKLGKETGGTLGQPSTLMRAGIFTALGIAIHNFPEGLVTFSSAVTGDVALGVAVAVAIAIHNIPEGIAVSVPIYYSTGSRKKAFWLSFSSGLAEPVGAIIGYTIFSAFFGPVTFGLVFAAVAGIMVFISLDELLPTAREYDSGHDSIYGMFIGMAVMALSLLLFM